MRANENIKFKTIGVKTIDELDFNNPVVYSSDSLISSMSYAGDSEIIKQSTIIDKDITDKLSKINGKFSLGLSGSALKNAHVYSKDAKYLDGIERICYLQQEGQDLIVSEFHGNRGAKYSALFKELSKRLSYAGFKEIQGKFTISRNNLEDFIKIVNQLINDRANGGLALEVENEIDSITIKSEKYFYYKAYWIKDNLSTKSDIQNKDTLKIEIDDKIKNIANYGITCNDIALLEALSEKIRTLDKLISDRIDNLKQLKLL
jgi:hypothetical protein